MLYILKNKYYLKNSHIIKKIKYQKLTDWCIKFTKYTNTCSNIMYQIKKNSLTQTVIYYRIL